MKQIIAIVKPSAAESVVRELNNLNPLELIVREVKGYGRQRSYLHEYRGNEYTNVFVAKVEITVWVPNELVEQAVKLITRASRTGRLGDGKILVLPAIVSGPNTAL